VDCFLERATLTYENTSELKSGDVQWIITWESLNNEWNWHNKTWMQLGEQRNIIDGAIWVQFHNSWRHLWLCMKCFVALSSYWCCFFNPLVCCNTKKKQDAQPPPISKFGYEWMNMFYYISRVTMSNKSSFYYHDEQAIHSELWRRSAGCAIVCIFLLWLKKQLM
jgi:hypothetical protein